MKQIDRLVIKELIGPWVFGVAMFASLLMAAMYLNQIAEFVVNGVPPLLILKITGLYMPAILSKTFAMAVLLAALLAFGRLSSDSEVTALRAAGASVARIVLPVIGFSAVVAAATFIFNNDVVPPAEARAKALAQEIVNQGSAHADDPVMLPIIDQGHLKGQVVAQSLDPISRRLQGVTVIAYGATGEPTLYMHCHELEYQGLENWRILGGGTILPATGEALINVTEAWPASVPQLKATPEDFTAGMNNDLDVYSMAQTLRLIQRGRRDHSIAQGKIFNLEYGYWNKISVALAALIFGTLGAVLGIRNTRTSAASGFALAVAIIFGYFTLANFMNVWAINGILPPWVASFAPIAIGFVCSGVIMWRRNV